MVSGHIDGTGIIRSFEKEGNAVWVTIEAKPEILRLIVEKGSVSIDGISLTVAAVDDNGFQVSVIPHTGSETTLLKKHPGDLVNLENDVVGKYVEHLLGFSLPLASFPSKSPKQHCRRRPEGITMDFLKENGI